TATGPVHSRNLRCETVEISNGSLVVWTQPPPTPPTTAISQVGDDLTVPASRLTTGQLVVRSVRIDDGNLFVGELVEGDSGDLEVWCSGVVEVGSLTAKSDGRLYGGTIRAANLDAAEMHVEAAGTCHLAGTNSVR